MTTAWTTEVEPLDVQEILRVLSDNGVQFVVVGGIAALAHRYSRLTNDIDVVPARDDGNLTRLCHALHELEARVYAEPHRTDLRADGSPPEVERFELTPSGLRNELLWSLSTRAGRLDVLFVIDGPGGYDVLMRHALPVETFGREVFIAGLRDLIDSKETAGRDKDLAALGELRDLLAQQEDEQDQA